MSYGRLDLDAPIPGFDFFSNPEREITASINGQLQLIHEAMNTSSGGVRCSNPIEHHDADHPQAERQQVSHSVSNRMIANESSRRGDGRGASVNPAATHRSTNRI